MKNAGKGLLLRLPAIILLVLCFIGSLVLKLVPSLSSQYPLSWAPTIVLFIILAAYFAGEYYNLKGDSAF